VGFALLALLGAASWGVGDFLGGLAARRAHVLTVLVISQATGLAGAAAWTSLAGDPRPELGDLVPAFAAGACVALGLLALYRGMAIGAMGIVAPISAAAPVVPLAVDLAQGTTPSSVQWLGIAFVLVGIMLLAREPMGTARFAAGVGLALLAALAFGVFYVGLDAAADASVPWTILAIRSAATALVLLLALSASVTLRPPARLLPTVMVVGVFDTVANVLVAVATTRGSAGVVAVLSALYPVATVLLARALLGEQLSIGRRTGGALALAGAAVVAVG
jgi:drug/metabolite transporter (DMT)-like permease